MSEENPVIPAANPVENPVAAVENPAPTANPCGPPPAFAAMAATVGAGAPQQNPVVMQPVSVGVGDGGELVFQSTDHAALARVIGAMGGSVQAVMAAPPMAAPVMVPPGMTPPVVWPPEEETPPVTVETVTVEETPVAKPRKPRTPPPNPSTEEMPFYAVFRDDKKKVVHVTPARRLWSEAKGDAMKWINKYGTTARMMTVYEGRRPAPNKGSKMARARTAWHIEQ